MKGNQTPRIRIEPPRSGTDGTGAAMLMEAYGVKLDEWQQLVIDAWLGYDENRRYNVTSAGLSLCRQCGKSELLICRCFYGLIVNGEKILFTSHQGRSVKSVFRRLAGMFSDKNHPEIKDAVKQIRYGTGEEAIELKNGGSIQFMSRSRQAARGFDAISVIILDEAMEVQDEELDALVATLSASTTGTRQMIYTGTPPYLGCSGEVFRRFRQSCIMSAGKGEVTRNSWHEWSLAAENINEVDLSDRKIWYDCIPALGYRLTEEFTAEEFKIQEPLGFAVERLGYWAPPSSARSEFAIDAAVWDACGSDQERPEGKIAYGVKFTPDGAEVVLAGAVVPSDGTPARITLLAVEPTGKGLVWLADWLNERYKQAACIVIDGKGGTDVLIDKIKDVWRLKGSVIKPRALDVVTAASMLINDLNERNVTWYRKQDELRDSAITAIKRPISGGYGFGGATSAPIEACSLALWACRTVKRDPSRKMRIG